MLLKTAYYWGAIYALVPLKQNYCGDKTSSRRQVAITANNNANKIIEQHVLKIAQLLARQSFGPPQEKLLEVLDRCPSKPASLIVIA